MTATPAITHARPIHAIALSVSPRNNTDCNADRHAQIGLRGRSNRTQRLHQPEIDYEGKSRRKDRQANQGDKR
jgi:hypothetical protein